MYSDNSSHIASISENKGDKLKELATTDKLLCFDS